MKIIAKTERGYLIDATENEIKAAMGHDQYADKDKTGAIQTGMDIDISESFKQLTSLRGARRQLDDAAKMLRKAADDIDAVKTPTVLAFDTKKAR